MEIILISLVALIPLYVVRRLSKIGAQSVFNFSLYPLIFSYFYLLIPALIPFSTALDSSLSLSSNSFEVVDQLSVWTVFVFFVGYFISKDLKSNFNIHLDFSKLSISAAKFIQGIVILIVSFILFTHGPALLALAGDRGLSYEYYAREVVEVYKLPVVWSFAVVSSSMLYFHYRKFYFLLPLLAFAVLDALQGGRAFTFAAVTVIGLNYLALNMNKFKRTVVFVVLVVFIVFASAFVRRFIIVDDTSDPLVIFFGEFFFTRLTAQITYDNLSASGDLVTYLLLAFSKMFPQFIVAPLFNQSDLIPYHVIVNEWADAGFGLAGSVMSEALYYGGVGFAVVSPLIISSIFLILSQKLWVRSLPGYLFFLLMVSSMYLIFRTGFYTIFFSTIYIFLFYFSIIIYPSIKRRVFL